MSLNINSKIQVRLQKNYARNLSSLKRVLISRYDPNEPKSTIYTQEYQVNLENSGEMYLDLLNQIKDDFDPTLSYRKSCREGICGSCAMNIDGENALACQLKIDKDTSKATVIKPLPHMFVMKDLITDLRNFLAQYASISPFLINDKATGTKSLLQSKKDREKLDGKYECILCACCSTACQSYWWNSDKFLGPAALLAASRWISDSRDQATDERLKQLDGKSTLFKCQTIMNCSRVCPKGLKPAQAISDLKLRVEALK